MTPLEFWEFLRALGPAGDEPKRYLYQFFQKMYNKFVAFRNFCLLVMVCLIIDQLWYTFTSVVNLFKYL